MSYTYIMKVIASIIEGASFVLLALSIFRIPVSFAMGRIIGIAVIINVVSLIQRDYLGLSAYAPLTYLALFVTLISILFGLPILYSVLIGITGYLSFGVLQAVVLTVSDWLGIFTKESSTMIHILLQLITTLVVVFVVYLLHRYRLGFMFIVNRFSIRNSVRSLNYMIGSIIVLSFIAIQMAIAAFQNQGPLSILILMLIVPLILVLVLIYKRNIREIENRFDKMRR